MRNSTKFKKGVKGPYEQIHFVFYAIACDVKMWYQFASYYMIKHKKKYNICSEGPFTPFPPI